MTNRHGQSQSRGSLKKNLNQEGKDLNGEIQEKKETSKVNSQGLGKQFSEGRGEQVTSKGMQRQKKYKTTSTSKIDQG